MKCLKSLTIFNRRLYQPQHVLFSCKILRSSLHNKRSLKLQLQLRRSFHDNTSNYYKNNKFINPKLNNSFHSPSLIYFNHKYNKIHTNNENNINNKYKKHKRYSSSSAIAGYSTNFNQAQQIPFGPSDAGGPSALLNQNVRGLDMSPTVGINEMASRLEKNNRTVYRLGFGQSPFPVPDFMIKELQKHAFQKDYLPVRGLFSLRQAIADQVNKTYGLNSSGHDVIVSPGSKDGIFLLQLAYYGELILPSPSWVSYEPQAQIIGRRVNWIHTSREEDFKLSPQQLLRELSFDTHRPRILILNYPGNPTGKSYTMNELMEFANIARQHRLIVLSDEIYGPLDHEKSTPHYSIAQFYPEGTIMLTGISKWCGAGGWRLGALVFPASMRWLLDACAIIASETYTAASAPIQYGAIPAFSEYDSDDMQEYLRVAKKVLHALSIRIVKLLRDCGAVCPEPDGGFYVFPDFSDVPGIENLKQEWSELTSSSPDRFGSKDLTMFLLHQIGVGGLGGAFFGRPNQELTMRLSYVNFDGAELMRNSDSLPEDVNSKEMDQFLEKYCEQTLKGFTVLSEYMKSFSQ